MRFRGLVCMVAIMAAPAVGLAQEVDTRPGIAVFPFTNGGSYGPDREDMQPLEVGLQQLLLTELAQNGDLRIVERSVLRQILEEQDLAAQGRVDSRTAAQVGKLVGARYVVTGVFIDLFGDFRLDGRVVDVETGEVLRTEEVRAKREKLYEVVVDLASKIMTGVELKPLPGEVREARRSRNIPIQAVTLYSRAQVYEDAGHTDRAIELYRQIADRFPDMVEAKQALRQLTGGEG